VVYNGESSDGFINFGSYFAAKLIMCIINKYEPAGLYFLESILDDTDEKAVRRSEKFAIHARKQSLISFEYF